MPSWLSDWVFEFSERLLVFVEFFEFPELKFGFEFAFEDETEGFGSFLPDLEAFELETELEFIGFEVFFEFLEFFGVLFPEWEEIILSRELLPVLLVDVEAAGGRRGDSLSKADRRPDLGSPWADLGAGVMGAVLALRRSLRSLGGWAAPDGPGRGSPDPPGSPGSPGSGREEVSTAGGGRPMTLVVVCPPPWPWLVLPFPAM